jgi:hypothetical protein
MLRKLLGAVVGYLAMSVFIMVTFGVIFAVLGTDGAFKPGSYEPSGRWLVLSFVVGIAGAILAGLVCVTVSRSPGTATVLAAIVFVLGLALAIPVLMSDAPAEQRAADVSATDAAGKSRQPGWVAVLNPFVGAAGILLGSRLRRPEGS